MTESIEERNAPYGTAYNEVKEKCNTSDSLLQSAVNRAYGVGSPITYGQMKVELAIVHSCIQHALLELARMIDVSGEDERLQF